MLGHDNGAFATYSLLRIAGARATSAVTLTAAHPAAVFKNSGKLPRQMWRSRCAMFFQVPGLSEWWASRSNFVYLETLWRRRANPGWELPAQHLAEVKATMVASWPAPLLHYRAMPFSGDETPLAQPTLYLIGAENGCVGHFLHLERPDVVTPRIVDWFKRHAANQ